MDLQEKAQKISNLYRNKDFQELILEQFLGNDIQSIVMKENVDSRPVQDELNARRILHDWLYDIIQSAEIAKTENNKDT